MCKFLRHFLFFIVLCVAAFSGHALEVGDQFSVDGLYYKVTKLDPPTVELVKPGSYMGYSGEVTLRSSVSYEGVSYSVTFRTNVLSNCPQLKSIKFDPDFSAMFDFSLANSNSVEKITLPRAVVTDSRIGTANEVPSLINATVVHDGKTQVFTIHSHNVYMCDGSLGRPYLLNNEPDYYTAYPERIYPDENGRLVVPIDSEYGTAVYSTHLIASHHYLLPLYFDTEGGRAMVRTFVEMDNSGINTEQGGLNYSIVNDGAVVRGLSGTVRSANAGDVVIPASIDYSGKTYPVTKVSYSAFYGCETLTSIDLGRINELGVYALAKCTALKGVDIPASVTKIGDYAFSDSGLERINFNSGCECGNYILNGTNVVTLSPKSVSDDVMVLKVANNIYYGNQVMPLKFKKDGTMYELDADGCVTLNKSSFMTSGSYSGSVEIRSGLSNITTGFTCLLYAYIPEEDWTTGGVSDITVGDENVPVEYYNLQGVRVAEPTHGIYIRRRGTVVDKIMVR